LIPRNISNPGYIIEFKIFNPTIDQDLNQTAERALKQIIDRNYAETLISNMIQQIFLISVVFDKKDVQIKYQKL
jgi:hypothetical protein